MLFLTRCARICLILTFVAIYNVAMAFYVESYSFQSRVMEILWTLDTAVFALNTCILNWFIGDASENTVFIPLFSSLFLGACYVATLGVQLSTQGSVPPSTLFVSVLSIILSITLLCVTVFILLKLRKKLLALRLHQESPEVTIATPFQITRDSMSKV